MRKYWDNMSAFYISGIIYLVIEALSGANASSLLFKFIGINICIVLFWAGFTFIYSPIMNAYSGSKLEALFNRRVF